MDLCGVGWMIICTNTGFRLTGAFWEQSTSASSYRVELLGLCALHILSQALAEFHKVIDGLPCYELRQHTCAGGIFSPHTPHPTKCKMRRHTPQSQGGQTATQWHILLCSRLRTYGPPAEVGATFVNPATQLRLQHPGETIDHNSDKPWLP